MHVEALGQQCPEFVSTQALHFGRLELGDQSSILAIDHGEWSIFCNRDVRVNLCLLESSQNVRGHEILQRFIAPVQCYTPASFGLSSSSFSKITKGIPA